MRLVSYRRQQLITRVIVLALTAAIGAAAAYGSTGHLKTDGRAWCLQFPHFGICNAATFSEEP